MLLSAQNFDALVVAMLQMLHEHWLLFVLLDNMIMMNTAAVVCFNCMNLLCYTMLQF
jgi:hypothetical protein